MQENKVKQARIIYKQHLRPLIIFENKISKETEIWVIENFKAANKNINDYNQLTGKDVTDYLHSNWLSLYNTQNFQYGSFIQKVDELDTETVLFPAKWDWIKVGN